MTIESIRGFISKIIQENIDGLDKYIYYQNNKYASQGMYCGPEPYSYEDDIYYAIREEINDKFRLFTLEIIKNCLDEEYKYEEVPKSNKIIPLDFIIERKADSSRIGFGLKKTGIYIVKIQNVLYDLDIYNLEKVVGIQIWESDEVTNEIAYNNQIFNDNNIQYCNIYMREFFRNYIDETSFDYYIDQVKRFYDEVNKKTSIRVIPILSPMYKPRFLNRVEREILDYNYEDSTYKFLKDAPEDKNIEYARSCITNWTVRDKDKLIDKYKNEKRYKILMSDKSFAKTFLTSEWLFYSINNNGEFDYTSIVTGYLKSIEQLLYYVMQLEINKDKYASIKLKYTKKALEKTNGEIYEEKYNKNLERKELIKIDLNRYDIEYIENKYCKVEKKNNKIFELDNVWVPFKTEISDYIRDTMKDYLHFFKYQLDVIPNTNKKLIYYIMDCFRDECRNGFFHTHIINSWDDVKKIRNNAFYIYFLIFGSLTSDIKID